MRRAALALVAFGVAGCPKSHKPPAMDAVWLGPKDGCAHVKNGGMACWGAHFGNAVAAPTDVLGRDVREVALGERLQCVLRSSGEVACREAGRPLVAKATGASAIAVGRAHGCAIVRDGEVECWGDGSSGQLVKGKLPGRATKIAAGPDATCIASSDPKVVRCFGRGATNDELLAGEDVVQLTVGAAHACALLGSGAVRCWGAKVEAVKIPPAAEVRAGYNHTCARLRDNTVVCWGANDRHQMADGTTDARHEPVRVQGLYGVTGLAAAGDATCAVSSVDGSVRCWGANDAGQLGDGTVDEQTVPMPVKWAASN